MTDLLSESRSRLLRRRAALQRAHIGHCEEEHVIDTTLDADWPDRASAIAVDEVLQRLTDRERVELHEIDAALGRIEARSYGRCEACGGAVGRQRLAAVPEARLCMGCAR